MAFDTDDFEKDVIDRSYEVPVLVDFWAEWCGPCKVLGPVLERLAQRSADEWELAKLDTDKHPAISARYGIRSIPNVKLFVDGEVANEFVGALPERTVEEWLKNAVPSKYRAQLEGARQLLLEDRAGEAREMLRPIVAAEPENHQAAALLAQALFGSDPEGALRTVEPIGLGADYYEVADAISMLDGALTRINDSPPPEDPVKDSYVRALAAARAGDFQAALDGLIEVVRKNRFYDDDGARKTCIAIFKLLGEDHPTTKRSRPLLSNALY